MTEHPDSEDPSLEPAADEPAQPVGSLQAVVTEVEHYVSDDGWDQPGRLFALVPTADLVEAEPDLAIELGVHENTAEALTPVEQEIDQSVRSLEELLTRIAWPSTVVGAVAVVERVVLPPAVERDLPAEDRLAVAFAAEHPAREDVRIAAGALRTGASHCVLRLRSHDDEQHLVHGADLVPRLVSALHETLEEADDDQLDQDWGPDE